VWAQFFGHGLVNPVDNLHEGNLPSHPELFEALTRQFVASGFDVKHLIRGVCNSQAYQRSSTPADERTPDSLLYASMTIKPMTPEQLFDSLAVVLGVPKEVQKGARKGNKGQAVRTRAAFVEFFHPNEGADPTEYATGIPQVLRLMNSEWTSQVTAIADQAAKSGRPPARNIEHLFLATLSRRPTAAESQRLAQYLQAHGGNVATAYGDILWALLNSSEFTLNH
jgi:hypothetical protein